ncbi:Thioredoxin-like protein YdbP [Bacillus sp. THAF10]|uniref:thioredoxin family protein n=1 Tax=Bacillus sp. THAF10 TaxID=2587848 RepID=UPI0012687429|nr:thioredoxin family protein [Bacillus sp. THAF10]QFT87627.1 Thioredoxin-like protein YdbP [Bacillus sp. THAF10]
MNTITSEKQFTEITQQDSPVVVKFYADWCPDCKRMDAFMPSVLEEVQHVPLHELNKDSLPGIAEEQQVMGIPSLLVYQNGEKIGHLHSANAKTPDEVIAFLSNYSF